MFCLSQSTVFQAQKDFNSLCACSVSLVLAPSFVTACTVVSLYYHNSQLDCSQRYRSQLDRSQLQRTQPYHTQPDPQTLGYIVQSTSTSLVLYAWAEVYKTSTAALAYVTRESSELSGNTLCCHSALCRARKSDLLGWPYTQCIGGWAGAVQREDSKRQSIRDSAQAALQDLLNRHCCLQR